MLSEEEVGWALRKKKSGGGRSGAIHWRRWLRRRRQLEYCLSEQRQLIHAKQPKRTFKGFTNRMAKGPLLGRYHKKTQDAISGVERCEDTVAQSGQGAVTCLEF